MTLMASLGAYAKDELKLLSLTSEMTVGENFDLHLTSATSPFADGATIDLTSPEGWLFFDNIRPNEIISDYSKSITVNGQPFIPDVNGRIGLYCHGSVVMAHPDGYEPLTTYTDENYTGDQQKYTLLYYYTNHRPDSAPENLCRPLLFDNAIRSLVLKRGYMATLATEPNGMGYSRVLIADTADLCMSQLPIELSGKVSYVRVFRWHYPTKKGWAGSKWTAMPEGLKYAPEQADFTRSTWYYNWGSHPTINPMNPAKTYNQEFVPEKWGAGGLWNGIYSLADACHLLGYNEPDHSEQSNVSVEKAIEEWPLMMQTGMRLGSPATTDFNWLYNFMNECRRRNYRVDYVVVHAYWGGLSAVEWYDKLKAVHQRTKRPIWIKEWNNGANWTHEGWPSSQADKYAKQLRDITAIVNMLDTCSFIERYSIYNWVEDKRMMIDSSGKLTPAGEFYAADTSSYFFNRQKELVPEWLIMEAPVLSYDSVSREGKLSLTWNDVNGEQIDKYVLKADEIDVFSTSERSAELEFLPLSRTLYTVTSVPVDERKKGLVSNAVAVDVADNNDVTEPFLSEVLLRELWQPVVFKTRYPQTPLVISGISTYRNKLPLSVRTRRASDVSVDLRLRTWAYQENPSFYNPDTLSYMVLSPGWHQWGDVTAYAGDVTSVDEQWQTVRFAKPFADTPVVICTPQSSACDTAFSICVRNVSRDGFELRLRFEGRLHPQFVSESVSFLAATPGKGNIGTRQIEVGLTPPSSVGSNLTGAYEVATDTKFAIPPSVFAQTQTENDSITSTLRLHSREFDRFRLFKDREKSVAHELVKAEQVGWLVVGPFGSAGIKSNTTATNRSRQVNVSLSGSLLGNNPQGKLVGVKRQHNNEIHLFNY